MWMQICAGQCWRLQGWGKWLLPMQGSCSHRRDAAFGIATHQKSLVGELPGTGGVCDRGGVAQLLSHRPSGLAQPFQVFTPTSHLHLLGIPVPAACPAENSTG